MRRISTLHMQVGERIEFRMGNQTHGYTVTRIIDRNMVEVEPDVRHVDGPLLVPINTETINGRTHTAKSKVGPETQGVVQGEV